MVHETSGESRTECAVTRGEMSNSGVVELYVAVTPKPMRLEVSSSDVQVTVAVVAPGVAVTPMTAGAFWS